MIATAFYAWGQVPSGLWIALYACAAAVIPAFVLHDLVNDGRRYPYRDIGWLMIGWAAILAAGVLGLIIGILGGTRSAGRANCHALDKVSGYHTTFRIMNAGNSGVCYAVVDGKLIPYNQVLGTRSDR